MDFLELLAKEHSFREGGFSVLALLGLPEAAINGDDAIRTWHLQLVVDVAWPGVETVEGGAAEDHVVCTLERDHLEGYWLFTVIIFIAEGNLEGNGPKGLSLAARNHSIESDSTMAELGLGEAYLRQGFHVHDIQAAAAIHQTLGELIALDQGVNHHGIVSIWDVLWMIFAAPLHQHLGPSNILADFRHCGV
jgi:hypothetical protein